jgi:hypothetical protein
MVEGTINYLAGISDRPYFFLYDPPPGTPWRNTKGDRHTMAIRDARRLDPPPSLDREGFTLARHVTAVEDLYDETPVKEVYYRELEGLVKQVTGAARVLAFDHNLRSATRAEQGERGVQGPVRYAHNDYTERSGPQRVRDLLGEEAEQLLGRRFAVINVWKPIRGPVEQAPLAVCDSRTIHAEDFVSTDLRYRDRTGEIYSLRWSPIHSWFYFPRMQADEAILLKCFDSDPARARFTAHSAFDDPDSPPDAPVRESIEVRTLAFFGQT